MKSSEAVILAVMSAIFAIASRGLKKSGLQRGLSPKFSAYFAQCQLEVLFEESGSFAQSRAIFFEHFYLIFHLRFRDNLTNNHKHYNFSTLIVALTAFFFTNFCVGL